MRLPRMTTRRWMILVALVSVALLGSLTAMRMSGRAGSYRARALLWSAQEADSRKHLVLCRKQLDDTERAAGRLRAAALNLHQPEELARQIVDEAAWWRANATHTESMVAYCSMMSQKYQHAARYPWLTVPPDPPPPYWSGVADSPSDEPEEALGQGPADQDAEGARDSSGRE